MITGEEWCRFTTKSQEEKGSWMKDISKAINRYRGTPNEKFLRRVISNNSFVFLVFKVPLEEIYIREKGVPYVVRECIQYLDR